MAKTHHPICRFCECPAVDGFVPLSKVDLDKLSKWSVIHMGAELVELDVERDTFCFFCVWDARFMAKNLDGSGSDELCWWPNDQEIGWTNDIFFKSKNDLVVKNCWVEMERIPDGEEMTKEVKSFPNSEILTSQTQLSCGDNDLLCKFNKTCAAHFDCKEGLDKHLRNSHYVGQLRRFNCAICNSFFNTKMHFKMHIIKSHLKCAFVCKYELCLGYFKSEEDLDFHYTQWHNIPLINKTKEISQPSEQ